MNGRLNDGSLTVHAVVERVGDDYPRPLCGVRWNAILTVRTTAPVDCKLCLRKLAHATADDRP